MIRIEAFLSHCIVRCILDRMSAWRLGLANTETPYAVKAVFLRSHSKSWLSLVVRVERNSEMCRDFLSVPSSHRTPQGGPAGRSWKIFIVARQFCYLMI